MPGDSPPRWQRVLEAGEDLAGALVGGSLGTLGGPPGVVIGAAAGVGVTHSLRAVGDELDQRVLSPRQRERTGAVLLLAENEIQRHQDAGEVPRGDGFFESSGHERPMADELLEGVLLQAGETYEERKLPYLANLYAAAAFDSNMPAGYAHYLLRLAERLTYQQFCLPALFADDLGNQGLLGFGQARGISSAHSGANEVRKHDALDARPPVYEIPLDLGQIGGVIQRSALTRAFRFKDERVGHGIGGREVRLSFLAGLFWREVDSDLEVEELFGKGWKNGRLNDSYLVVEAIP